MHLVLHDCTMSMLLHVCHEELEVPSGHQLIVMHSYQKQEATTCQLNFPLPLEGGQRGQH